MGDGGTLPKILAFILSSTAVLGLGLRTARGKDLKDDDDEVSMVEMWEVDDGGSPGGLSEPSGITIKVISQKSPGVSFFPATCGEANPPSSQARFGCGAVCGSE